MKHTKISPAKKARLAATHKKRRSARPIHKRVLLHPFTVFVLLCVGVLVAGSTFRGQAATYDVTAIVPAPPLTSPAVITQPANNQHVTTASFDVRGDCPAQAYVKLYRNAVLSGASLCVDGHFSVQTLLAAGANELKAHVFNLTDQEGPSPAAVMVHFDLPTTIEAPAAAPVNLKVSSIENNGYRQGVVSTVSENPTVSGLAPPYSDITVTFYSVPSVCKTKADGRGVWSCTLASSLAPGKHEVVIVAMTPEGHKLIFPPFHITVAAPLLIHYDYDYQTRREGQPFAWDLSVSGGTAPYELHIDWGDDSAAQQTQAGQATLTLSHTYEPPRVFEKTYTVLITATDAEGRQAKAQLAAAVKGSMLSAAASQPIGSLMSEVKQWLWVIWPVYVAVCLMALSFWIGEQEAYHRFLVRNGRKAR